MNPKLKNRSEILQELIRRIVAYTDQLSWFGPNSVIRAILDALAGSIEGVYLLWVALVRRFTLSAASGDTLSVVAAERGVTRLPSSAAKVLVVVVPESATVTAITTGPPDLIEVDDSSIFAVGMSCRIRNSDGSITETFEIAAITTGTGPHGGDELELVAALANSYTPASDETAILIRASVPVGTRLSSSAGVVFETIEAIQAGDSNPVLDGESAALGLVAKGWAEATTKGIAGNIEPYGITGLETAIDGVLRVLNPEPGTGGEDTEADYALKYRTMHYPTLQSQETNAWIEALAKQGDSDVLRALRISSTNTATMGIRVLHRNGGGFSATKRAAIKAFVEARVRSYMLVEISNVVLTSVEVSAVITLDPNTTLRDVFKAAAAALVEFLDYRRWSWGADVDEADLLSIVNGVSGVASLETSSFSPAANVVVAANSLPTLTRLVLTDSNTGDSIGADLTVTY